MLFPIIKVKDNNCAHEHIVGTNRHDQLYVDHENGGLQYLNMQCLEGTSVNEGEQSYSFMGKNTSLHNEKLEIEFVTIEQLIEIAIQNMKEQTENKIQLDNMIVKYFEEKEESLEKLKNALPDTSGML